MKKCPGCTKEIDKYAYACQYCKRLLNRKEKDKAKHDFLDLLFQAGQLRIRRMGNDES